MSMTVDEHELSQLGVLEQIREELAELARASGPHGYMYPLHVKLRREPMGQESVAVGSQPAALNPPRGARGFRISVENAPVRFWDGGGMPDASHGHLLNPGDVIELDSDPLLFHAIATGANANLQVTYYA